jgi:hypothetical protein
LLAILKEYEDRHIPDKLRTAPIPATEAAVKYKAEETLERKTEDTRQH